MLIIQLKVRSKEHPPLSSNIFSVIINSFNNGLAGKFSTGGPRNARPRNFPYSTNFARSRRPLTLLSGVVENLCYYAAEITLND